MSDRRTSIILIADAGLDETSACVGAIHSHTAPDSYELLVVDFGLYAGSSQWLAEQDGLLLVPHEGCPSVPAAINLGLGSAQYDNVLILNARTIVTAGYLPILLTALHGDPTVGAVGPASNAIQGQTIPVTYESAQELAEMAADFNSSDPTRWDERLRLSGACLLVKREALEGVGRFDEGYTFSTLWEHDFSFKLIASGWTLRYARDVFVHFAGHAPPPPLTENLRSQLERFVSAWGFDPTYSSIQRSEVIALLDPHPADAPLRVLELGCACGATLLEIKNRYPNAEIYGIELNEGAVAVGRHFADIRPMNAEMPLEYPERFFDYVITADVLEHLVDPWRVVANIRPHLKETGKVIASIPNIMHVSVIRGLLSGRFCYQDAGILDRTHLRFFTLTEIDSLFAGAGYGVRRYSATTVPTTDEDLRLVKALKDLSVGNLSDQFQAYQYLVTAAK